MAPGGPGLQVGRVDSSQPVARTKSESAVSSQQTALGKFLREHCGSLKEAYNVLLLYASGSGEPACDLEWEQFDGGLKRMGYDGESRAIFNEMNRSIGNTVSVRDFIVYFMKACEGPSSARGDALSRESTGIADVVNCAKQDGTGCSTDPEASAAAGTGSLEVEDGSDVYLAQESDARAEVSNLRQELNSIQSETRSSHLSLLQAVHVRPTVSAVSEIVKLEVARAVSEATQELRTDVEKLTGRLAAMEKQRRLSNASHDDSIKDDRSGLRQSFDGQQNMAKCAMDLATQAQNSCSDAMIRSKSELSDLRDTFSAQQTNTGASLDSLRQITQVNEHVNEQKHQIMEQKHELLVNCVLSGIQGLWSTLHGLSEATARTGNIESSECLSIGRVFQENFESQSKMYAKGYTSSESNQRVGGLSIRTLEEAVDAIAPRSPLMSPVPAVTISSRPTREELESKSRIAPRSPQLSASGDVRVFNSPNDTARRTLRDHPGMYGEDTEIAVQPTPKMLTRMTSAPNSPSQAEMWQTAAVPVWQSSSTNAPPGDHAAVIHRSHRLSAPGEVSRGTTQLQSRMLPATATPVQSQRATLPAKSADFAYQQSQRATLPAYQQTQAKSPWVRDYRSTRIS